MSCEATQELIKLYTQEKIEVLKSFPIDVTAQVTEEVWRAYKEGNTIYACGNGGNASYVGNFITDIANHPFVSDDKSKPLPNTIKRLRALDLTSSGATLTGLTNDLGFENVFAQQLLNDGIKEGDLVFGFSGSGNSGNVLNAFDVARSVGARNIAITRGTGGKSKEQADYCIVIPGTSTFPGQTGGNDNNFHFEDALSSIAHMITGIVKKRIQDEHSN